MSDHNCPVEGCDYAAELSSLRSHVNAKPDHPAWSDVEEQALPGDDGPVEATDGPQEEAAEGGDDAPETSEDRPAEQAEASESGSSDMASDDEYRDQHEQAIDQGESPDADGDDDPPDRPAGGIGFGAIDRQTAVLLAVAIIGAVVVLSLLRRRKSGRAGDGQDDEGADQSPTGDDDPELGDFETGLIQEGDDV